MKFGSWQPLAAAAQRFPDVEGIYQVRLEQGLLDYRSGKSAMIHYGHDLNVRTAVARFADSHEGRAWLVRFSEQVSTDEALDLPRELERLHEQFRRRFGTEPRLP